MMLGKADLRSSEDALLRFSDDYQNVQSQDGRQKPFEVSLLIAPYPLALRLVPMFSRLHLLWRHPASGTGVLQSQYLNIYC